MDTTLRRIRNLVILGSVLAHADISLGQAVTHPFLIGTATFGAADGDLRNQVDDLLTRARESMHKGDLETAERLVSQAEQSKVRYNLMYLGDTPAKARRALEKAKAAKSRRPSPKLPSQLFQPLGADKERPSGTDPFAARPAAPGGNEVSDRTPGEVAADRISLPQRTPVPGEQPAFGRLPSDTPQPLPNHEATPEHRMASDHALHAARRALAVGDTRRAAEQLETARSYGVTYGFNEDSPAKVEAILRKYQDVIERRPGRENTEAWRRQYSGVLVEQAEALLRWNDYSEAERLASDASQLGVNYGPYDITPNSMLDRISATRKHAQGQPAAPPTTGAAAQAGDATPKSQVVALLAQAREALSHGQVDQAESLVQAADRLNVPETEFAPGEDRAWRVKLDIEQVRTQRQNVSTADGADVGPRYAQRTVYDGQDDSRYQTEPPAAQPQAPYTEQEPVGPETPAFGPGEQLLEQGEQALRNLDKDAALRLFHEAQQHQLSPEALQRLNNHLQLLSAPPARGPVGEPSLIDSALAGEQLQIRQLSADVAGIQIEAGKLREKDPQKSLELLNSIRERIVSAKVPPAARDGLLRRIDLSIGQTQQYIKDNKSQIDLDQRNREVLADVEASRWGKVETQEKLAKLVEEFNTLSDEQRYAEMEVVAKRAMELAPEEIVSQQLSQTAKMLRRLQINGTIAERKEAGAWNAFASVEESSQPHDDRHPIIYPDAKIWKSLSDTRSKRREGRLNRSESELDIERKLQAPVSVRFHEEPLEKVVEHLSKLTGVNVYLDPRGLAEEGVTTDRPVTIMLTNEVSLKSALRLLLEPLHLSYVIENEVLKITSEQMRSGHTYTVTYDVADLVIPIPNFVPGNQLGLSGQLNDAYSGLGYNNASPNSPMAVIAGTNGQGARGQINPTVMAQMGAGMGSNVGRGQPISAGPGGLGGGAQADFDQLIDMITSTVQPESWEETGGPGSIREFATNLSMVVSQTEEVHQEIVDLLEQLRRLQDLQVTIEVRFIRLNDNFFERIGVDFDFNIEDNTNPATLTGDRVTPSATVGLQTPTAENPFPAFTADLDIPFRQDSFALATPGFGAPVDVASFGFAILSDIEAFFLVNASQGDRRSNVMQAPKVTLFNGQQAFVADSSQTPFVMSVIPVVGDFAAAQQPVIVVLSEGTFLTIQAVVSKDRRYVRLTVVPFFSQIGDVKEFTFEGTSTSEEAEDEKGLDDDENPTDKSTTKKVTKSGTTVQLPTFSFVTVTTTVSVPDGGTVLLGGIKRLSESRNEFGVPLLAKLPYINRLFRNVGIGRDAESLMMMVTPRIIIQEEEEERLGINVEP